MIEKELILWDKMMDTESEELSEKIILPMIL
jgi:hypothetical protein